MNFPMSPPCSFSFSGGLLAEQVMAWIKLEQFRDAADLCTVPGLKISAPVLCQMHHI